MNDLITDNRPLFNHATLRDLSKLSLRDRVRLAFRPSYHLYDYGTEIDTVTRYKLLDERIIVVSEKQTAKVQYER